MKISNFYTLRPPFPLHKVMVMGTPYLPVNDGFVLRQSEHPGFLISQLEVGGDTPDLDESKPQLLETSDPLPVLVKPCSQTHGVNELPAEHHRRLKQRENEPQSRSKQSIQDNFKSNIEQNQLESQCFLYLEDFFFFRYSQSKM